MAAVSHELRTPLTSVLGHLELLADSPDLPASLARRVEVIERNATRLQELVGDLLQSAADVRRTAGDHPGAPGPVRVAPRCRRGDGAASRGPPASTSTSSCPRAAWSPASTGCELRQVVDNLLTNAVKYTEPGGRVSVRLWRHGSTVDFSVADTGIGVAPEEVGPAVPAVLPGRGGGPAAGPGRGAGAEHRPWHRRGPWRPDPRRHHPREREHLPRRAALADLRRATGMSARRSALTTA